MNSTASCSSFWRDDGGTESAQDVLPEPCGNAALELPGRPATELLTTLPGFARAGGDERTDPGTVFWQRFDERIHPQRDAVRVGAWSGGPVAAVDKLGGAAIGDPHPARLQHEGRGAGPGVGCLQGDLQLFMDREQRPEHLIHGRIEL